jgi:hypothetical protein
MTHGWWLMLSVAVTLTRACLRVFGHKKKSGRGASL